MKSKASAVSQKEQTSLDGSREGNKGVEANVLQLCCKTVGSDDVSSVLQVLDTLNKELPQQVEGKCKLKENRLKKLQTLALQVLHFCHLKFHKLGQSHQTNPRYEDCLASALSMYLDIVILLSRHDPPTSDHPDRRLDHTCRVLLYLLQHSPQHLLDVLLQVSQAEEKDAHIMVPLCRRVLLKPPIARDPPVYTKYVCAVRHMCQVYKTLLADVQQVAYGIGAPKGYLDWVREHNSSILDQFPETTKFRGVKITRFLLHEADDEIIDDLLDLLMADDTSDKSLDDSQGPTQDSAPDQGAFFVIDTAGSGPSKESKSLEESDMFVVDKDPDACTQEYLKEMHINTLDQNQNVDDSDRGSEQSIDDIVVLDSDVEEEMEAPKDTSQLDVLEDTMRSLDSLLKEARRKSCETPGAGMGSGSERRGQGDQDRDRQDLASFKEITDGEGKESDGGPGIVEVEEEDAEIVVSSEEEEVENDEICKGSDKDVEIVSTIVVDEETEENEARDVMEVNFSPRKSPSKTDSAKKVSPQQVTPLRRSSRSRRSIVDLSHEKVSDSEESSQGTVTALYPDLEKLKRDYSKALDISKSPKKSQEKSTGDLYDFQSDSDFSPMKRKDVRPSQLPKVLSKRVAELREGMSEGVQSKKRRASMSTIEEQETESVKTRTRTTSQSEQFTQLKEKKDRRKSMPAKSTAVSTPERVSTRKRTESNSSVTAPEKVDVENLDTPTKSTRRRSCVTSMRASNTDEPALPLSPAKTSIKSKRRSMPAPKATTPHSDKVEKVIINNETLLVSDTLPELEMGQLTPRRSRRVSEMSLTSMESEAPGGTGVGGEVKRRRSMRVATATESLMGETESVGTPDKKVTRRRSTVTTPSTPSTPTKRSLRK